MRKRHLGVVDLQHILTLRVPRFPFYLKEDDIGEWAVEHVIAKNPRGAIHAVLQVFHSNIDTCAILAKLIAAGLFACHPKRLCSGHSHIDQVGNTGLLLIG